MKRRALLAALGASSVPLAGCLGDEPTTDASDTDDGDTDHESDDGDTPDDLDVEEYDECQAPYVDYADLPSDIAAEVDAAFAEGVYESDDEPLYVQAVNEVVPLWKDDVPYRTELESDGSTYRLSFEKRTGDVRSRELFLRNSREESVSVEATVTDGAGSSILELEQSIDPSEETSTPVTEEYGEYDVEIAVQDGPDGTYSWTMEPHRIEDEEGLYVTIDEDGLSFDRLIVTADYVPCPSQWTG